jgi:hypothetical protein
MKLRALLFVGASALVLVSCAKNKRVGTRDSGQSRLMSQTFAGQNACNPENHLRPFIIEWDATDRASFESHAANDVVVVRYEGCNLTVLDECRNDSIRGSQGSYRPPEWTSGALETIGISNEAELVAKLPLGAASLGGRVNGGESFHMEYYVAGTVNATRDTVYAEDLAGNPGCAGATHFVYGYNLGAFALASTNNLSTDVGGSYFGFSAEGHTKSDYSADKKGGDLGVCQSDSATEVMGCKTPVRLTLRPIREGDNPQKEMMTVADTDDSLNMAGLVKVEFEMGKQAQSHYDSAVAKMNSRDGKGCIAELDVRDKLDDKHNSTDPKMASLSMIRAQCLMLAGKCEPGKQLLRKAYENTNMAQMGPEHIDRGVEAMVGMYCQGKMGDRDALLQALMELQKGAYMTKKEVAFCDQHYATVKKMRGKVKPKDDDDSQVVHLDRNLMNLVPACYQRAGDCKKAWTAYQETALIGLSEVYGKMDKAQQEQSLRQGFESMVSKCKDK